MIHHLKTIQPYFEHIYDGVKTFEIRKNDRDFRVGDILFLKEYRKYDEPGATYSGREVHARIAYMFTDRDFGVQPGYCVLGLTDIEKHDGETHGTT